MALRVVLKIGEKIKVGDTEIMIEDRKSEHRVGLAITGPRDVPIVFPQKPAKGQANKPDMKVSV